jgi:catechol 2,3-dioxygenase-like lactoylglutathione lyase family enzyme
MKSSRDVIVRAENLEAAKSFYHGIMEFAIVQDSSRLVGFDTGSFTLYVEHGADATPVFDFLTDTFDETKARLLSEGCSLVEEDPALLSPRSVRPRV